MLLILQADDVGHAGEDGEAACRQHLRRLQFFAAQAYHHRGSSKVWIQTQIAQRANGNFRAGSIDCNPASVGMSDRNHIVDVGVTGQDLRSDTLDRELHRGRDTLHRGCNSENVLRSDRAVRVEKAFEGISLERRQRIRHCGGETEARRVPEPPANSSLPRAPSCPLRSATLRIRSPLHSERWAAPGAMSRKATLCASGIASKRVRPAVKVVPDGSPPSLATIATLSWASIWM